VRKCGINELEQTAMAISNQQTSGNTEKIVDTSSMMGLDTWQAAIFKVILYYYCFYYSVTVCKAIHVFNEYAKLF